MNTAHMSSSSSSSSSTTTTTTTNHKIFVCPSFHFILLTSISYLLTNSVLLLVINF
jgi:hypothetical protein